MTGREREIATFLEGGNPENNRFPLFVCQDEKKPDGFPADDALIDRGTE
jgi:hypothetical protein